MLDSSNAPTAKSLVDFYLGRVSDFAGRHIDNVWQMSFDELEYNHDYIQWLFPLRDRSSVEPDVPVLDDATIHAFDTPELRERVVRSSRIMADFYGLEIHDNDAGVEVRRSAQFEERRCNWLTRGNHNFLRLTRIMKSLTTLGHRDLARAWQAALLSIYEEYAAAIGPTTLRFWRDAVT